MISLLEQREKIKSQNRLVDYKPYAKQREFHAAGKKYRERLFMAGNRCGKTQAGAYEMAFHLTGLYPDWWEGKRFESEISAWASGVTGESTRDVVQEKLLGNPASPEQRGTGSIPAKLIGNVSPARGVANGIDSVMVQHVSGKWSTLQFKSYEKGREKWQGTALHVIWLDEECPLEIYTEALTRTNETGGIVYITFTPLLGVTELVHMFQETSV